MQFKTIYYFFPHSVLALWPSFPPPKKSSAALNVSSSVISIGNVPMTQHKKQYI